METRILKVFSCLLWCSVVLSSCGGGSPHVAVLQGNYAFGRGHYQTATVHYFGADVRQEHEAYISYNLGNVYYALGELDAARESWDIAAGEAPDQILFGVHFNRGVLFYELARYREAHIEFRQALKIDESSVDAKINLELSLQKLESSDSAGAERAVAQVDEGDQLGTQAVRVLQYIRRKERQRWFAEEGPTRESATNDW